MKKTLTINLNNTVFHIDEDAYELLQSYLAEVGNHLKNESEKADIMADIEARIAELFIERMDKTKNVVTIDDVDAVITVMGKPSQFVYDEEDDDSSQNNAQSASAESASQKRKTRKYYRDIDNQLLGGVASGLSAFLNWDAALIRIIFVVLTFITSGTFILIYLLMWLIVPKAATTAQKLEMQGEDVNIETIKNKMVNAKEYLESDNFKNSASEVGNGIWRVLRVFLRVVFTMIIATVGIIGVIVVASLILALIVFLLQPDALATLFPDYFGAIGNFTPDKIILLIIGSLLIIGCPIFAFIYWATGLNAKNKTAPRSNTPLWISLILWLAGIIMFVGAGGEVVKKLKNSNFVSYDFYNDNLSDNPDYTSDVRTLPDFNAIETSGAFEIELTQQPEQMLSVNTLREYIPNVKTEVTNGTLKILSTDNLIRPIIKIKIGIDSVGKIEARGATKINFTNSFNQQNLGISLRGASKAHVRVNSARKLEFDLQGASKLDIIGTVDTLLLKGDGASKIDADKLAAKVVKAEMNGASKAEVFVSESFDGQAYGASRIEVKGNPAKKANQFNPGSSIQYE